MEEKKTIYIPEMTRRQWLAGLAMQSLMANPHFTASLIDNCDTSAEQYALVAKSAYEQADAMLAYEKEEEKK